MAAFLCAFLAAPGHGLTLQEALGIDQPGPSTSKPHKSDHKFGRRLNQGSGGTFKSKAKGMIGPTIAGAASFGVIHLGYNFINKVGDLKMIRSNLLADVKTKSSTVIQLEHTNAVLREQLGDLVNSAEKSYDKLEEDYDRRVRLLKEKAGAMTFGLAKKSPI